MAQQSGPTKGKVQGLDDLSVFAKSFDDQKKLLLLSLPHSHPADDVLERLDSNGALKKGDVILDREMSIIVPLSGGKRA